MGNRAQSQYLRLYDSAGVVYSRWQNYHAQRTVTWDSQQWNYLPFEATGLTDGSDGDEAGVTVTLPALPMVVDAALAALAQSRLCELRIYQFNTDGGDLDPPAGQLQVAVFTGELVRCGGGLTAMTWELGSALSPVGAQIPPRTLTTALMGQGCRL